VRVVVLYRYFELQINGYKEDGRLSWNRTAFGKNTTYQYVYVDVLYIVLCFAVPLVSLTFMNWRVIVGYRAARRRRRSIMTTAMPTTSQITDGGHTRGGRGSSRSRPRTGEHESALTLVMIAIVIVFIACQAPARLVQLIWGYVYSDCRQVVSLSPPSSSSLMTTYHGCGAETRGQGPHSFPGKGRTINFLSTSVLF